MAPAAGGRIPGAQAPGGQAPPPAMTARTARWSRWGWLFSVVWLIYLAYPIAAAARHPGVWGRAGALTGLVLFALAFVAAYRRAWSDRFARGALPVREALACLAAMALLLAAVAPVVGEQVVGATTYIVVLAVMVLPSRWGWPVALAVTAVVAVLTTTVPGWQDQDPLIAQLLLAAVAGWGVGQLVTRNRELVAARETISELAVVAERERVSRDLHDILGHSLSVVAIKAELAGRLLGGAAGPEGAALDRVRAEVDDIESLARQSLADVRRTVARMRSVTLEGELAAAASALTAAGIEADLPASAEAVPPGRRELFAWALREGVTNVVRHSGARRCAVTLRERAVIVDDDGHGPGPRAGERARAGGAGDGAGSGLGGLRARAAAAGAVLRLGRGPLGGMRMEVEVP